MKAFYDDEADALYLRLGEETPEGKLVGIEILNASKKMDIKTLLSYKLEVDKKILAQRIT